MVEQEVRGCVMESPIMVCHMESDNESPSIIRILCSACGEMVELPDDSPVGMLEASRQSFEVLHEDCQKADIPFTCKRCGAGCGPFIDGICAYCKVSHGV